MFFSGILLAKKQLSRCKPCFGRLAVAGQRGCCLMCNIKSTLSSNSTAVQRRSYIMNRDILNLPALSSNVLLSEVLVTIKNIEGRLSEALGKDCTKSSRDELRDITGALLSLEERLTHSPKRKKARTLEPQHPVSLFGAERNNNKRGFLGPERRLLPSTNVVFVRNFANDCTKLEAVPQSTNTAYSKLEERTTAPRNTVYPKSTERQAAPKSNNTVKLEAVPQSTNTAYSKLEERRPAPHNTVPKSTERQAAPKSNNTVKLEEQQETNNTVYSNLQDIPNEKRVELLRRFKQPKNVLHNVFNVIADETKQNSYTLQPQYSLNKGNKPLWECTYFLKWPEQVRFVEAATTKKEASNRAALLALQYLVDLNKLTKENQPIIYDKETIKKKQVVKELELTPAVIAGMTEIVDCYERTLLPQIEKAAMKGHEAGDGVEKDWFKTHNLRKRLKFRTEHYFCNETVKLPITEYKDHIIETVENNQVVIIKGEPGCGKSTRVPQYIMEGWAKNGGKADQPCRIIVTQPRRIAAMSLAERVAKERHEEVGPTVGFKVRLLSNFNNHTGSLLYCTTGILLRRLQSDPNLLDCTHVVLDEAHERDVNVDLLLNLVKLAVRTNPNLKIIVMSATINAEMFQRYFESAAIVHVPGFTYPVKESFLNDYSSMEKTVQMCEGNFPSVVHEDVAKVIKYVHKNKEEGAILCFLPGWDDILKVQKLLPANSSGMHVLCLHSRVPYKEQQMVFRRLPPGVRKVILSTNIAETSITIDDVVYVIDTGIEKEQRFDNEKGIVCVDNRWISKASAKQRRGRAGRVRPGESYHLYPEDKYRDFEEYADPEILRTSLTKIVLDSKVYSNNAPAVEFLGRLLTPPEPSAISRAVDELRDLELLDGDENVTPLGAVVSEFQLEPKLAKALVNSVVFKCVTPIVDIITLYASEVEIFTNSLARDNYINKSKKDFSKSSDHLSMMRLFEKWLEFRENDDERMAMRFCTANNLAQHKMELLNQLREIHFGYLEKGLHDVLPLSDDYSDNDELVKAVLLSGVGQVLQHRNYDIVRGRMKNCHVLLTRNGHKATITADSVNHKRTNYPSDYFVYINETRSNTRRVTVVRETSLISTLAVLLFKNNNIVTSEVPKDVNCNDVSGDKVLIKLQDTNIKFLCDRSHAEIVKKCKSSLTSMLQYYIFQLTKGNESNAEVNKAWNLILTRLNGDILKTQEK